MADISSFAPTALLILAGVLVGIGALLGLLRGFRRAFLRFLTVAVAFFGSLFVCRFFLTNTQKILSNEKVGEVVDKAGISIITSIETELPEVYATLIGLPVAILAPLVFTILFIIVATVLAIVYFILGFFVGGKRKGRLIGLVIGAVQGALVTVAILVPVNGLLSTTTEALDIVSAKADESEVSVPLIDTINEYRGVIDAVTESPVYALSAKCGGTAISESLMRYAPYDKELDIKEETKMVATIYGDILPLLNTKLEEFDQKQIDAIYLAVDDFGKSEILPTLIAGFLNGAGSKWAEGEPFLGTVAAPKVGEGDFDDVMDALYEMLGATTDENVDDNFRTLVDVLQAFIDKDHGSYNMFRDFSDSEAMKQTLADHPEIIEKITSAFESNPNYDGVATAFKQAAFRMVCKSLITVPQPGDDGYEEYQTMTTEIADALNSIDKEELAAFLEDPSSILSGDLTDALGDFDGVAGEAVAALTEIMADSLKSEFGEKLQKGEDVTAEDIQAFIAAQSAAVGG